MADSIFYVCAHLFIALLYAALAWFIWRTMPKSTNPETAWATAPVTAAKPLGSERWALPFLALAHGALLVSTVFHEVGLRFGFALALSATLWVTVLILWFENFFVPLRGLLALVLPLAAVAVPLPLLFDGVLIQLPGNNFALRLHLVVAILAYSLLTIAALHALLMMALDRQLHGDVKPQWARLFRNAPPLLAMERLLFRLIGGGFVLLTATVLSGVFFSEQLFGRPLRFEHKTLFALASWAVFGGLLIGRKVFGWRGRLALRWTLTGFVMLLLAYVGTRFVLEVILHRSM